MLWIKRIMVLVAVLAIWQLAYFMPSFVTIIPSPVELGQAFWLLVRSGVIFEHIGASLQRVLVGFGLAAVAGTGLALLLGYYRRWGEVIDPVIEILRPIPPIAWIPIAIILFGLGDPSAYFIVFLGAFFPIFVNSYFGVTALPEIYRNVARSFEVGHVIYVWKILLPFSLPYIMTGFKIGMGMAWMSVIAAELIGAQNGLGYFIQMSRLLLQIDNVIIGMVAIGIVGWLLSAIIVGLERIIMPWRQV